VKPAIDLGLGLLYGVNWSIAVLIDRTMAFARSSISYGSPADGATGISLSNDGLKVWIFVSLHRLLGVVGCCPIWMSRTVKIRRWSESKSNDGYTLHSTTC
jgi:hypothetical protein